MTKRASIRDRDSGGVGIKLIKARTGIAEIPGKLEKS